MNNNIKISSNKNFGIVFFFVFLIVSLYPLLNGGIIRYWSLVLSILFLILGLRINASIKDYLFSIPPFNTNPFARQSQRLLFKNKWRENCGNGVFESVFCL